MTCMTCDLHVTCLSNCQFDTWFNIFDDVLSTEHTIFTMSTHIIVSIRGAACIYQGLTHF